MRYALLVLGFVASIGTGWSTQAFNGERTAGPLLFVVSRETHNGGLDVQESLLFVFRDGSSRLASLSATRPDPLPRIAQWARLQATRQAQRELSAALAAAEVGRLRDCRFAADSPEFELFMSVRWFGRSGRENTFRLSPDPALPLCGPATRDLVTQLTAFRRASRVIEAVSSP